MRGEWFEASDELARIAKAKAATETGDDAAIAAAVEEADREGFRRGFAAREDELEKAREANCCLLAMIEFLEAHVEELRYELGDDLGVDCEAVLEEYRSAQNGDRSDG
jgi:flagellar biosynthesis/type III secretory pathway protein FliH